MSTKHIIFSISKKSFPSFLVTLSYYTFGLISFYNVRFFCGVMKIFCIFILFFFNYLFYLHLRFPVHFFWYFPLLTKCFVNCYFLYCSVCCFSFPTLFTDVTTYNFVVRCIWLYKFWILSSCSSLKNLFSDFFSLCFSHVCTCQS